MNNEILKTVSTWIEQLFSHLQNFWKIITSTHLFTTLKQSEVYLKRMQDSIVGQLNNSELITAWKNFQIEKLDMQTQKRFLTHWNKKQTLFVICKFNRYLELLKQTINDYDITKDETTKIRIYTIDTKIKRFLIFVSNLHQTVQTLLKQDNDQSFIATLKEHFEMQDWNQILQIDFQTVINLQNLTNQELETLVCSNFDCNQSQDSMVKLTPLEKEIWE